MRKFFLIPLLACFSCVMAWGEDRHVSDFAGLTDAIADASVGTIYLDADFTATSSTTISRSVSINGQNHTITGAIKDNGVFKLQGSSGNQLLVTIENIKIVNSPAKANNIILYLHGYIDSLAINNCELICSTNVGNPRTIAFDDAQPQAAKIGIHNSHIYGNNSGYSLRACSPAIYHMTNSKFEGYGCLNFQYPREGGSGARGTQVYAKNCDFDAPNIHSGSSDAFFAINFADDGISVELDNCGMNAEMLGNAAQWAFGTNGWNPLNRRSQDISVVIKGDNTYINGDFMSPGFTVDYNTISGWHVWENGFRTKEPSSAWYKAHPEANDFNYIYNAAYDLANNSAYDAGHNFASQNTANVTFTIMGGTYAINPDTYKYNMHVGTEDPTTHMPLTWIQNGITIPSGYEVKTIETQQGATTTTLYRVRQAITGSTALNDNAGQNPTEDIKVTSDVTLENTKTAAEYVEVKGGAGSDPAETVTVTVGSGKTLTVSNGLDVTGNAEIVAAQGSTLVVGEGGLISEKPENIVIEANENGSASLLLDPEVIVNTTPNLTVKMTVKGKGYKNESAGKTYYWHRFAAPVVMSEVWTKAPSYGTWLYGWDYNAAGGQGAWAELASSLDMVPFQGYTLSPEHLVTNENEEIVYIFKGQLAGNQNTQLRFNARGFNFFGNSYTGYIDLATLVDQLMGEANIDGTVYVWRNDGQGYESVSLQELKEHPEHFVESWETEIAPMQTFILRQINTGDAVSTELNYASSVWGNPRYSSSPTPAPARRTNSEADPYVRVVITAANGQSSQMNFAENADRSDDFEKGYDAIKYMNENTINIYSTMDGQDYSSVATDNLEGKTITLQTNDEIAYTMSFPIVDGENYAIRDNATNQVINIEAGATYAFAAQPNSTIADRFEIVSRANMPTAIENTEVKANVKGIYTIMGQYLGENFDILPAGVYVVDGVKIVK